MQDNSFKATLEVAQSPQDVFDAIRAVSNWWSRDMEGKSEQWNDEFTIHHPNAHYSKQKLTEVVPYKKMVWLVTESHLNWIKNNKEEWTNTKMIFDIAEDGDKTKLYFTHEGLTPDKECYAMCEKGWTTIISNWLFHYINTGKPSQEMNKASDIRKQALADHESFHTSITANVTPKEAFEGICQVNEWWGHIEGPTKKLNDVFTYRPNDTWVNFKITKCNEQEIVWHVTDCFLHFQKDKKEWKDTDVVFQMVKNGRSTTINFTHVGLVPEVECYENCRLGWTHYIEVSLLQLLTTGKGQLK